MSDVNDFKNAMSLLMSGRRHKASTVLLSLYQRTTKKEFRLQIIDALIAALDPVKENQRLIDISTEGIRIANRMRIPNLKAHFMARKADFLMTKWSFYQYHRANLKLTPGWNGFSIEADKLSYERLTKKIEELEKEVAQLLKEALVIAEQTGDKKVLGFVLMAKASVESFHYLQYKSDCVRGTWRIKFLLFLHRLGFEPSLLFGIKHHNALKAYIDSFVADYLKAAELLEEIEDDSAGFAYFDLAVHLQSAYEFRKSIHYLRKAEIVAKKHNNALLIAKIKALEESLKMKNKDVPNYLEGETRDEIVV